MKQQNANLKLLVGIPEKTARGGINACEPPFLRALENLGVDVREEIYTLDNAAGTSVFQRINKVIAIAAKFRRILRAEKFDVLHLNTSFDAKAVLRDAFTVFRLKKTGTKIFLKFHGGYPELLTGAHPVLKKSIEYLLESADGVGVLSTEEKRAFVAAGFPEAKFFVVKNAVARFARHESFPHVENFAAENAFRLLFVSRLIATKGLLETIEAVSLLREQGFGVVLDVLGDGETRAAAEALAKSLGVAPFVRFRGHVDEREVQAFYAASDLLVFPTFHAEGFPMVIFNALQFGLPVVTTKIRAAADYLHDGENGFFCEARNPRSVAEKIAEIIRHKDLRARMSENNRILANEFTAQKIAPEYLEIYRRIL